MRERPGAQEWFFFKAGSDAGLKAGPFSWERLLLQARSGTLEPKDVVWDPNSGWKTATQIPGLFTADATSGGALTTPDAPPQDKSSEARGRSRLYWISALVALVMVGGGLGAYFGFASGGDDAAATTTSMLTATTQSTPATGAVTATDAHAYVIHLDESDSHHDVEVHVGDTVRIDLAPWAGSKLKSVWWDFRSSLVQKIDSGSEVVDNAVVGSWLELKALAVGQVTIRAQYKYPNDASKPMWVAYLFIKQ